MGYTSEISLTIRNDDFQTLLNKACEHKETTEVLDGLKRAAIYQTDKYTTLHWDWYKWYEDYPEVQFIECFKSSVPHVFHRLGESDDDYEYSEHMITNEDGEVVDEAFELFNVVSVIRQLDVGVRRTTS